MSRTYSVMFKRSGFPGFKPENNQMVMGEIGVNYADKILFYKPRNENCIKSIDLNTLPEDLVELLLNRFIVTK